MLHLARARDLLATRIAREREIDSRTELLLLLWAVYPSMEQLPTPGVPTRPSATQLLLSLAPAPPPSNIPPSPLQKTVLLHMSNVPPSEVVASSAIMISKPYCLSNDEKTNGGSGKHENAKNNCIAATAAGSAQVYRHSPLFENDETWPRCRKRSNRPSPSEHGTTPRLLQTATDLRRNEMSG